MKLRKYQEEAISTIEDTFKKHSRQFIVMPTGSGKTFTFLSYAKRIKGNILIVVPSIELLSQVYESALLFYDEKEISRKGNRNIEPVKKVHLVTIQSCNIDYLKYLCNFDFELIIIDEAHHSQSPSYKRLISSLKSKKILGVTATPDRLDGQFLYEILHTCSVEITLRDLMEQKFLCDLIGFSVKTNIDISNVDAQNHDFSTRQLYEKLSIPKRNEMIVDCYLKHLKDRKTLIFCINIEHSKQIEELLNSKNISARHIDGKMNLTQRNSILSAFKSGQIQVLTNCQILTEGFDEPSIDGIILARPTKSRSLFLQMIGRGLRLCKGKHDCKVIDILDNHKNLATFIDMVGDASHMRKIESFNSYKELVAHFSDEFDRLSDSIIERADLIDYKPYHDMQTPDSVEEYLRDNNIDFYLPLTLMEGCFLVWKNELKKRLG